MIVGGFPEGGTLRFLKDFALEGNDLGGRRAYLVRPQELLEMRLRDIETRSYKAIDVDRSFVRCLNLLMSGPGYPMIATHDPRLLRIAAAQAELGARTPDSYEYQMLYGVRPAEQRRLAATGARLRVYLPYGQDWYRYLVRRLAERPANVAFFARSLVSTR